MNEVIFTEYPYLGISGKVYYPTFESGVWWLINSSLPMPLYSIAIFCGIPEEDVLMLKLKYGENREL